ncbi:MAG: nucleotide exchange factor GrpE [Planctomycetota bacterium]
MARKTTSKKESGPSGKSADAKAVPKPAPSRDAARGAARKAPCEAEVHPPEKPAAPKPEPGPKPEHPLEPMAAAKPPRAPKIEPGPAAEPAPRAEPAPGAEPAPPEKPPSSAPKAPSPPEWPSSLVAEVETRIARGVEHLEAKLGEVSKSVREILARGLASLAPPAPPPPKAEAPPGPPPAELEDLTASVRRAMAEAIDRKLEEVIGPAVSLYNRLRDEERALAKDPSSLNVREARKVLAEAASELEKILRVLGGEFIRPKLGEFYDPLIHLAVGEAKSARPGAGRGETAVVADVVTAGYRSARGKVVCPARVLVEKR